MEIQTLEILIIKIEKESKVLEVEHDRIGDELENLEEIKAELIREKIAINDAGDILGGLEPPAPTKTQRSRTPGAENKSNRLKIIKASSKPGAATSNGKKQGVGNPRSQFKYVQIHGNKFAGQIPVDGKKKTKFFDDEYSAADWVVTQLGLGSIEELIRE